MEALKATEGLIVGVLKTAILHGKQLDHLGVSMESFNAFLVFDEVLHAAQALAHAADRLAYGRLHFHYFALAMEIGTIFTIRRVCKALENIDVFMRTSLVKGGLMAHAK